MRTPFEPRHPRNRAPVIRPAKPRSRAAGTRLAWTKAGLRVEVRGRRAPGLPERALGALSLALWALSLAFITTGATGRGSSRARSPASEPVRLASREPDSPFALSPARFSLSATQSGVFHLQPLLHLKGAASLSPEEFPKNLPENFDVSWRVDGILGGSSDVGTVTADGKFTPGRIAGTHHVSAESRVHPELLASGEAVVHLAPASSREADESFPSSHEQVLSAQAAASPRFGRLRSLALDAKLDGRISGRLHFASDVYAPGRGDYVNLILATTDAGGVYAWDADSDSPAPLWYRSFPEATGAAPLIRHAQVIGTAFQFEILARLPGRRESGKRTVSLDLGSGAIQSAAATPRNPAPRPLALPSAAFPSSAFPSSAFPSSAFPWAVSLSSDSGRDPVAWESVPLVSGAVGLRAYDGRELESGSLRPMFESWKQVAAKQNAAPQAAMDTPLAPGSVVSPGPPTVAQGKVFVASCCGIEVYGLRGEQRETLVFGFGTTDPEALPMAFGEFESGDSPFWVITGAAPGAAIRWTSYRNGKPTGEQDADYGLRTDESGSWSGYGSSWAQGDEGTWVRTVKIGSQQASVVFGVTRSDLSFTADRPEYEPGQAPRYTIRGAPPGARILWSSRWNGKPTAEQDADYSTQADSHGNWSGEGGVFGREHLGSWTRSVRIGSHTRTLQFEVGAATRKLGFKMDRDRYAVGESPSYTIRGAAPFQPILFTSLLDGRPTGEQDTDYGLRTDAHGGFSGRGFAWTSLHRGQWVRTLRVGDRSASTRFEVR